jgi:hypothetical protein
MINQIESSFLKDNDRSISNKSDDFQKLLEINLFQYYFQPIVDARTGEIFGNERRNVIIDGGNIQCDFPDQIIPVNTYGTPLVARIIMDSDEFCRTVDTVTYSYDYQASYCDRYPYIKVYLPESFIL